MNSYTPTVWQSNDLITAEKLNKIENRIKELQNISVFFDSPPSYNTIKQLLDLGVTPIIEDPEMGGGEAIHINGYSTAEEVYEYYNMISDIERQVYWQCDSADTPGYLMWYPAGGLV